MSKLEDAINVFNNNSSNDETNESSSDWEFDLKSGFIGALIDEGLRFTIGTIKKVAGGRDEKPAKKPAKKFAPSIQLFKEVEPAKDNGNEGNNDEDSNEEETPKVENKTQNKGKK